MMMHTASLAHGDLSGAVVTAELKSLSDYAGGTVISHWHDEFEIIYITEGRMCLSVEDSEIPMIKGDIVVICPHRMHSCAVYDEQEDTGCRYICVMASPRVFSDIRAIRGDIIDPIMFGGTAAFFRMNDDGGSGDLLRRLTEIAGDCPGETPRLEAAEDVMEAVGIVHILVARSRHKQAIPKPLKFAEPSSSFNLIVPGAAEHSDNGMYTGDDRQTLAPRHLKSAGDAAVQREMITYICQNYAEKITLADIAEAGHVCRSRCCAIFRRYLRQSPIDFLNSYRLAVSVSMLRDTDDRISEIAAACGFLHQSYYSKMFGRKYGCTPNEARSRFRLGAA